MTKQTNKSLPGETGNKGRGGEPGKGFWRKTWHFIRDWSTIIIIVLVIRAFGVESMIVPTGSMEETIMPGDALLVNKFRYGFKMPFTNMDIIHGRDPRRGDVIVFRYPHHGRWPQPDERYVRFFPKRFPLLPIHWDRWQKKFNFYAPENWVKRCVGLPGDTVEVVDKYLYVNGKPFSDEAKAVHQDPYVFPRLVPREEFSTCWMDLLCFQFKDSLYYADSAVYKSYANFDIVRFENIRLYYDSLFNTLYYSGRIPDKLFMHYLVSFYMLPAHLRTLRENGMALELPLPEKDSFNLRDYYNRIYMRAYNDTLADMDSSLYVSYIMHFYMRDNFGPIVVPEGMVFGMGDNRDYSHDCRYWGFVPQEMLKGSPAVCYYSLGDEFDRDSNKVSIPMRILGTHWERIGRTVE